MSTRWWTLVVWALVAASGLAWGFKLFVKPTPLPPQAQVAAAGAPRGDWSRLLGADAPPPVVAAAPEPAPDARFQLLGVVTPRTAQAAREGLALIAVDGKPAKAFRVGAAVEGQTVLQSVNARGAMLGPRGGAAQVALNLAPPAAAATGMLPPPGMPQQPPAQQFQPQFQQQGQPQFQQQVQQRRPLPMPPPVQPQQPLQPNDPPPPNQTPEQMQQR